MKRVTTILLICLVAAGAASAAERITPRFIVDTETAAYVPLGFGTDTSDTLSGGFGVSQDVTLVNPISTFGFGLRTGITRSPVFETMAVPIQAVVSSAYNTKLGVGTTLLLSEATNVAGTPSGLVLSGVMSFSWPVAEVGNSFVGLLFGVEAYSWTWTDSFGTDTREFAMTVNLGLSLSFDPLRNPINKTLFPGYTGSYEY